MDSITLTRPDDMHLHLRDGAALASVVAASARQFGRAMVMPNLKPPVTTVDLALAYRERILAAVPDDMRFEPLMTLYLTDNTRAEDIQRAAASAHIHGVKYYPSGATTNSDQGVTAIEKVYGVLETMAETGLTLQVHGEVTDQDVDVFDREAVFIDRILLPLTERFSSLRIVLEHITTEHAVSFVLSAPEHIAATITPQHLLYNRNSLFQGGLRPHHYCLPVLKREQHRRAVVAAATGGHPRFFLGTDSAPHAKSAKESACGCAGIYSAPGAMEWYATVFESENRLDRLEAFASINGARFYGLAPNPDTLTLVRTDWQLPSELPFGDETIVPLGAGTTLHWKQVEA